MLALGDPPRTYKRGMTIRAANVVPTGFFVQLEGWAIASTILPDGGRQILKVHLPGDALGTPSMAVTHTVEMLTALTSTTVSAISFERFGRLIEQHPRIGITFMLSIQRERIALMDQLASVGRTSAESRIAALFCDLLERLEPAGLVSDSSFMLPMTQEEIGDVTGLSGVHVNRTLREFKERGLIVREGKTLTILDRDELSALASRPVRRLARDAPWVPASR